MVGRRLPAHEEPSRKHAAIATGLSEGALFGLSGLHDANSILSDVHRFLRQESVVLEIGCGIGRLLRFFALVFAPARRADNLAGCRIQRP